MVMPNMMAQQPYNPYLQQNGASPMAANTAPPSFKNLKAGNTVPIGEFVGECSGFRVEYDQNYNCRNIYIGFKNIQVLMTDSPWPYGECEIRIRESESLSSGWGIFGQTVASSMGKQFTDDDFDFPSMVGNSFHIVRIDKHIYGFNRQTNQVMSGIVWKVVRMVVPGEPTPQSVYAVYQAQAAQEGIGSIQTYTNGATPTQGPVGAPPAPQPTPIPAPMPAPAQPPQAPPAPPAPPAPSQGQVTNSPADYALSLLLGKTRSQFFEVALPDQSIQADPALANSIIQGTFFEGLKAAGIVNEDAQGVFTRA